jgi:hypothetical protein
MSPCLLQHYIIVRNKKCNSHDKCEKYETIEKYEKNNSKRTASSASVDLNMVDIVGTMWL